MVRLSGHYCQSQMDVSTNVVHGCHELRHPAGRCASWLRMQAFASVSKGAFFEAPRPYFYKLEYFAESSFVSDDEKSTCWFFNFFSVGDLALSNDKL